MKLKYLFTASGLVCAMTVAGIAQNTNSNTSNSNSNRSNSNNNRGSNSNSMMNSNSNSMTNSNSNSMTNSNSNRSSSNSNRSTSNSNRGSDMDMSGHNMSSSGVKGSIGGMATLDMKLAMDAAYGNNAEIAAAQMALQKTSNADIRSFAQMMIDHHTAANTDLMRITGGMSLPTDLDPHHRAVADGMAKLSGTDFDMAYVIGQKGDHAAALDLHEMIADDSKNKDLKAYGKKTEPVVKRHFEAIKQIDMKMAGAATAMPSR